MVGSAVQFSIGKKVLSVALTIALVFGILNASSFCAFAEENNANAASTEGVVENATAADAAVVDDEAAAKAATTTADENADPAETEANEDAEAAKTAEATETASAEEENATEATFGALEADASACTDGADCAHVVKIGDKHYASLSEAVTASVDGDTVTLIADINNETNAIYLNKAITLDLNGKTINLKGGNARFWLYANKPVVVTGNGTINNETVAMFLAVQNNVKLTINNGTFHSTKDWILYVNGKLTNISFTIEDGTFVCDGVINNSALYIWGEGSTLTMKKGTVKATGSSVVSGTTMGEAALSITTNARAILGDEATGTGPTFESFAAPISSNNVAGPTFVEIYGGTYKACSTYQKEGVVGHEKFNTVAYLSAEGTAYIKGGTFINANTTAGSAISIPYTKALVDLSILGGKFTSKSAPIYIGKEGGSGSCTAENPRVIAVMGGSFSGSVSAYCPADYRCDLNKTTNLYDVKARVYVAKIGETKYETLGAASNASVDGDTITLLANWEKSGYTTFSKSITIDLNGKVVNSNNATATVVVMNGATVTFRNGTIKHITNSCTGAVYVYQGSAILEDVTVTSNSLGVVVGRGVKDFYGKLTLGNGTKVTGAAAAVLINGDAVNNNRNSAVKSEIIVNEGATVTGTTYGIAGSGTKDDTLITINGGTITAVGGQAGEEDYSAGIYHPQQGTLTINGGTISGKVGVQMAAGDAVINGGKIISTDASTVAAPFKAAQQGDGMVLDGAALSMVSRSAYGDIDVKVNGGTFQSTAANKAVQKYGMQKTESAWEVIAEPTTSTLAISGGTFSSFPSTRYVADGLIAVKNANGQYVIEEKKEEVTDVDDSYKGETVAQVGGTVFGSIVAAIEAVANAAAEVKTPEVVIPVTKDDDSASETTSVAGATIVLNKAAAQKVSSANPEKIQVTVAKNTEKSTDNTEAFDIDVKNASTNTNLLPVGSGDDIEITVKVPCATKSYKYAYYVDGNKHSLIDNVQYDGDCAVFTTNHLSTYKLSADVLNPDGTVYKAPEPTPLPTINPVDQQPVVPAPAPVLAPAPQLRATAPISQNTVANNDEQQEATTEAPAPADNQAAGASAAQAKDDKKQESIEDSETPMAASGAQSDTGSSEFPLIPVLGGVFAVIVAGGVVFVRRKATN